MKNKETQAKFLPVFVLCLCLACLGLGCLGIGGGGGSSNISSIINPKSDLSISGRAYFYERQIYGNIPIIVKNIQKETVAVTTTDPGGYYSFSGIMPGVYYVSASTGESEVTFGSLVQVTGNGATEISQVALLCITDVKIDQIGSDSFHIEFNTNRRCRATIEYGAANGYIRSKTIDQAGYTRHETTISGLDLLTDYSISIYMTGDDGQEFVMRGLSANTTGLAGCSNLSLNINQGNYETSNRSVTLYMQASDCEQMRISDSYTMDNADWINYSPTYNHTFSNGSNGIKRVYAQFKSNSGIISPIQSDSIVYTSSGYAGVWINDGEAVTNKATVQIKAIYPGATQMIISDNQNFSNSYWETYIPARKWTFNNENGIKTIYCRFRGGTANADEVFNASILYDTTPPTVEILINDGKTVTATTSVVLDFSYNSPPNLMKVANNNPPSSSQDWVPFKQSLDWTIPTGDGNKSIFAIFKDSANNQYGPVSAGITLDTVAPTGNSISIHKTDSDTSEVATFSLIENLPMYLHFKVTDNSTYKAHYHIGEATSTIPTTYLDLSSPFGPVELNVNNLKLGENKIWVYFSDEAGNKGFMLTERLVLEGPEINLSPSSVEMTTGQTQNFIVKLKNIGADRVGNIKWTTSGSGSVDSDGIYTAPSPIYQNEEVTIRGESALNPALYGTAKISLRTSVEIAYLQNNGSYTKEELEKQIMPGEQSQFQIYLLHNPNGIKLLANPSMGVANISQPVLAEFGSIATITYTAPSDISEIKNVRIDFCAFDSSSVTGKVNCIISTGANIVLNKSSDIAQRNSPVRISAEIANTSLQTLTWRISPINAGSFSPNTSVLTTTTNSPNHVVNFYAGTPNKIILASVTAEIGEASRSVKLSVYPPSAISIEPIATYAMPIVEPILLNVNSVEYQIPGNSEELIWQFKNKSSSDFMPADGKQYVDRGSLTVLSNTQVQYQRPVRLPSSLNDLAQDIIEVRAISVADPQASCTATITLAEKVKVEIFDDIEKTNKITSAATVIEVGTLQFYAKVTPSVISNTSVAWTVNAVNNSPLYGSIDSNGKYTAPNVIDSNQVTIRATSNYDTSAYAEVAVDLNEFWTPKRQNLVDQNTGEPMPISAILVDPKTSLGEDFIVYAGTGAENKAGYYGMWVATFSDQIGDTSGGYWQGIPGLSSSVRLPSDHLLIYAITMGPNREIYASTGNGIYFVPRYGTYPNSAIKVVGSSPEITNKMPDTPIFSIEVSKNASGKTQILGGSSKGVYKMVLLNNSTVDSVDLLIDTQSKYHTFETRVKEIPNPEGSGTINISVSAYCDDSSRVDNPIKSVVRSVLYDSLNKSLYFGTANNKIYHCPTLQSNMATFQGQKFIGPSPAAETQTGEIKVYNDLSYPNSGSTSGIPLIIALDVINTNTLWCATTNGVARSIDYGATWSQYSFTGGVNTNCRSILVDPNNTINVMSGSEDGLYRSINGGASWTRIKSGLGNYKTITCLTQASGAAGKRRKVWVGTSGGVFLGKQSLSLE